MGDPRKTWAPPVVTTTSGKVVDWTGPNEDELTSDGSLVRRVPAWRWPYGPPHAHEPSCNMFSEGRLRGGLYCDCEASAADDDEYGVAP